MNPTSVCDQVDFNLRVTAETALTSFLEQIFGFSHPPRSGTMNAPSAAGTKPSWITSGWARATRPFFVGVVSRAR